MFGRDKNKPVSPIIFGGNTKESPISFIGNEINNEDNFAITKFTDNGKFMRGNLLFFSLNGVEVYTDPNNIIFVDMINKTMFVREYNKVSEGLSTQESGEEKQYIILYTDLTESENEEYLRWEAVQGRRRAYDSIKINAPVIDIDKSIVLAETVALKDALTVREFANYLVNANFVEQDDFDINQYASDYV